MRGEFIRLHAIPYIWEGLITKFVFSYSDILKSHSMPQNSNLIPLFEKISYRKPGPDEIRHVCLKLLRLEDPVSRYAQIRKYALRSLAPDKDNQKQFKELSPLEVAQFFSLVWGSGNAWEQLLNALVSLALALSELRLYRSGAFAVWQKQCLNELTEEQSERGRITCNGDTALPSPVIKLIRALENLTDSQKQWLFFRCLASPDWLQAGRYGVGAAPASATDMGEPSGLNQLKLGVLRDLLQALEQSAVQADAPSVHWQYFQTLPGALEPRVVLLVEGNSECIILPHVARVMNIDLAESGILLVSSGGARQVARRYLNLRDLLGIAVVAVLDGDALEEAEVVEEALRPQVDLLRVFDGGELEDSFNHGYFLKCLSEQFAGHGVTLSESDFEMVPVIGSRKEALAKLCRRSGLGDFDKLEFAQIAGRNLQERQQVPAFLQELMLQLNEKVALAKAARGKP